MIELNTSSLIAGLCGGALIGLACAMLLLLNGRIAGVSGIVGGIVGGLQRSVQGDTSWRLAFILGLLSAPAIFMLFAPLPTASSSASDAVLIGAGLLVGVGTRYGSGCTSGHGVCGIARLSMRSMMATVLFMLAGFATVYVCRHLLA